MFSYLIWTLINKPILFFAIALTIFNPSLQNIIVILLSLIIEFLLKERGHLNSAKRKTDSLIKLITEHFINNNSNQSSCVEEIEMQRIYQLIPKSKLGELFSYIRGQNYNKKFREFRKEKGLSNSNDSIRVFVIKKTASGKLLTSSRAYCSFINRSYIFLTDYPEEFRLMQRFILLHELGHLSYTNISMQTQKYILPWQPIYVFIIILLSINQYWILILLLIVLFFYSVRKFDKSDQEAEAHADLWALYQLNSIKIAKKIHESLNIIWNKSIYSKWNWDMNSENLEINLRRNLFNQTIKLRNLVINNFLKKTPSKINRTAGYLVNFTIFEFLLFSTLIFSAYNSDTVIWPFIGLIIFELIFLLFSKKSYKPVYEADKELENILNKIIEK